MNNQQPLRWRKSSRSNNNGGSCVEVSSFRSTVSVRDTKLNTDSNFPHLTTTAHEWTLLITAIRKDQLHL